MLKSRYESSEELVAAINSELEGYEGYVQFSHRPIDKNRDIFIGISPKVENEAGFIYEAHFCNGTQSISIRQVNGNFIVLTTDISDISQENVQAYLTDIEACPNINMAQIWEAETDKLCEGMPVEKLQKVVFAGFVKGGTA